MGTYGKPGGQCIEVGNIKYPIHVDGWMCCFQIQKPKSADLANYPIIKLTSSTTYESQRRYSCRFHQTNIAVEKWRARLRLPTIEITKATLAHIQTLFRLYKLKQGIVWETITKLGCGHLDPVELMILCIQSHSFSMSLPLEIFNIFNYFLTIIQNLKE